MKAFIKKIFTVFGIFLLVKTNRRILFLLAISIIAFVEFNQSGLSRKTFVFFTNLEGQLIVEERMLHTITDRETEIERYIDEVLLGPVSPGLDPLFPRNTRLISYMYRDGIVYADLSESALFPVSGTDGVFRGFLTLNEGIRRNFSHVEDVKLFIGGMEVFFNEFNAIFTNSADNNKTSP